MEVVVRGKPPEKVKFRFICPECNSILGAEKGELKFVSEKEPFYCGYEYYCPVCEERRTVSADAFMTLKA